MHTFMARWRVAVGLMVVSMVGGCQQAPMTAGAPAPATAKPGWDAFVGDYLDGYFKSHPAFAVIQGRHEFDGVLPDWSEAGLKRDIAWLESKRAEALAYADTALDARQRFERD